jgi:hypothetical protein
MTNLRQHSPSVLTRGATRRCVSWCPDDANLTLLLVVVVGQERFRLGIKMPTVGVLSEWPINSSCPARYYLNRIDAELFRFRIKSFVECSFC